MVCVLKKNGVFERRRSRQGVGAGNGVFSLTSVKAGTMLPYFGITIRDDDDDARNLDRTYVMSADYTTASGRTRVASGLSVDGNPRLARLKKLPKYKLLASQVNEASDGKPPNCLLVNNPLISKSDITRSLEENEPILISYIVVVRNLPADTELLTLYGSEYGDREYVPSEMKRVDYRQLVEKAYAHLDALQQGSK